MYYEVLKYEDVPNKKVNLLSRLSFQILCLKLITTVLLSFKETNFLIYLYI